MLQLAIVASAVAASADHALASLPLLAVVSTAPLVTWAAGGDAAFAPAATAVVAAIHVALVAVLSDAPVDMVASMCGALAGLVLTPNKAVLAATVVWASLTASVLFAALAADAPLWWGVLPTVICVAVYGLGFCVERPKSYVARSSPRRVAEKEVEIVTTESFLY